MIRVQKCGNLTSTKNVLIKGKLRLLARFNGDVSMLYHTANSGALPFPVSPLARGELRNPDWRGVEQDLTWLSGPGRSLVCLGDGAYPVGLTSIADPPLLLFVAGDRDLLSGPQIAMVGARAATANGCQRARRLARGLSLSGLTVTSGLAAGIDSASHEGALAVGGSTVGVAAHGLDQTYPRASHALFARVAQAGAVISEYGIGVKPLARRFPRRNRLVSGLSLGVLVVEASLRSGSLITARLAGEQGREVFAVPGAPEHTLYRGCHKLLKDGAKLVEVLDDILDELPPWAFKGALTTGVQADSGAGERRVPDALEGMDEVTRTVFNYLDFEPVSVEQVVELSGLTAAVVSSILLALEIHGLVASDASSRFFRATEA